MFCAAQAGALSHNNTNNFFFVFSEVTCKNIMCTRQQIFLYIQDKWGATLQELEILENKFSAIKIVVSLFPKIQRTNCCSLLYRK
jgi:hypothetical protein